MLTRRKPRYSGRLEQRIVQGADHLFTRDVWVDKVGSETASWVKSLRSTLKASELVDLDGSIRRILAAIDSFRPEMLRGTGAEGLNVLAFKRREISPKPDDIAGKLGQAAESEAQKHWTALSSQLG